MKVVEEQEIYSRVRGLHVLPAFGDVLFEFAQRAEAEFALQFGRMALFGHEYLPQSLNLLLHLMGWTENDPFNKKCLT